jgi:hypothetical protein
MNAQAATNPPITEKGFETLRVDNMSPTVNQTTKNRIEIISFFIID